MAHTPEGTPEQILYRTGYTVSYNSHWKQPNWVSYELLRDELQGNATRNDRFTPDYDVVGTMIDTRDYTHSGYDRGHMAPAADMKWNETAMEESFLLSKYLSANSLNKPRPAGKNWKNKIREWVQRDSALLITCGPFVSTPRKTIGRHEIVVPARFFKVVAVPYSGTPRGIAFIFDNEAEQPSLKELAITIDSVERVTGIDFFHNLPDSIEQKIESDLSLEIWNLN